MALGKKTGGRNFKKGQGGRKRGAKNKIPRSFKRVAEEFFKEVHSEHPDLLSTAVLRGLKSRPATAIRYVELWMHYAFGRPVERLEHTGKDGKPIQAEIRTVVFGGRYKPDQAPEPS